MNFRITGVQSPNPQPLCAYLIRDKWNDWGKYCTQFYLIVFDEAGVKHDIGSVKIGQRGLAPSGVEGPRVRSPSLPIEFELLEDDFFSIGQEEDYYVSLGELSDEIKSFILLGLRDCAYSPEIFRQFENEEVMSESLLRSVSRSNVLHRFNRLAHGHAVLTRYDFEYTFPSGTGQAATPSISFQVKPSSEPPTNVHVLIGRNGVGKTRCLQCFASAVLSAQSDPINQGVIASPALSQGDWDFVSLVTVSFSAFDEFQLPVVSRPSMNAHQVGLKDIDPNGSENDFDLTNESPLTRTFVRSLRECRRGPRRKRLIAAVEALENDPLFAEAAVAPLLNEVSDGWKTDAVALFKRLSSGHKIVLLTITRLVELVDERTVVLLDEPEGHLHPPLLSAFVRALSDLLIKRNGLAIIATHSPVVLQEVPKSCVWVLGRAGKVATAERPSIETFGENVGVLTREVFGLEVTHSGFHQMLKSATNEPDANFDNVLEKFGGQLGAEAQAIIRSMLAIKANDSLL